MNETFNWVYGKEIDTPEKVAAISELIMKYEQRGIRWSQMVGATGE